MPRKTSRRRDRLEIQFVASMRPRPDAAENVRMSGQASEQSQCFNEAAARCRGKLTRVIAAAGVSPRLQ